MREAVSGILSDRAQQADGFSRMVLYSLIAHGALISAIVLMPEDWRRSRIDEPPAIMTITLGPGAPGPDAGGRTPIAAPPVQQVAPPIAKPAPQPAPAAKVPEMVVPAPIAKPAVKAPSKPIEKPDDKSSSRKPTTGAEIKPGAAKVQTGGVATEFGGLATGGAPGGPRLDVQNFCCPDYLITMTQLIHKNWEQNQGAVGMVDIRFVIQRDGTITEPTIEKPSTLFQLDQAALRAVVRTRMLPPLPRQFPDSRLVVHLTFDYK